MRGRLIFPFGLEIYRRDRLAVSSADSTFREPALLPTSDGIGAVVRPEQEPCLVPGQFCDNGEFLRLQMAANGNLASSSFQVLLAFADLEALDLVDPTTGLSRIRVGDRLNAIYNGACTELIQKIPNPPGLFVTQAEPRFGLGGSRNLLVVTFESRDPGGE